MPVLSERLNRITIEKPTTEKNVISIETMISDTNKSIKLYASTPRDDCKLKVNRFMEDIQIEWIEAGIDKTLCLFVKDPTNPSRNLLTSYDDSLIA